jgi:hypothetical protein
MLSVINFKLFLGLVREIQCVQYEFTYFPLEILIFLGCCGCWCDGQEVRGGYEERLL